MESDSKLMRMQANLGRGEMAAEEMRQEAIKLKADIILVQEPYVAYGRVSGMGIYSSQIVTGNRGDEKPWACIVVLSPDLTATLIADVSTAHCVCAHIQGKDVEIYAVSLYCQFKDPVDIYMMQLQRVMNVVDVRRVLIGADVNAVSPLWTWRAEEADGTGQKVEQFMMQFRLKALNRPGELCTYIKGNRDIDITMVDERSLLQIRDWTVKEEMISSDHRVIITCLMLQRNGNTIYKYDRRFNVKKADWNQFIRYLKKNEKIIGDEPLENKELIEKRVEVVKSILIRAARKAMPKKRRFYKSVPW